MKLTLHSFEDLERLLALLGPKGAEVIGETLKDVDARVRAVRATEATKDAAPGYVSVTGTGYDFPKTEVVLSDSTTPAGHRIVTVTEVDNRTADVEAPELDADGRRWDARIDSSNKGLNKDGTWRARRNHGLTEDEVTGIKAELMKEANDAAEAAIYASAENGATVFEPGAGGVTETHPLPVDEPESAEPDADNTDAALQATFSELVEQARKPAEDIQKDDIATTLQAAQAFTKVHGTETFQLLRATITDKTLPGMTPGERRVLLAAMELYKPGGAE